MYVTKITLKEAFRCLPANLEIVPEQLTLLVGDQGCGKSSLLELLNQHGQKKDSILNVELTKEAKKKGVQTFYFDAEKHNPRITNPMQYTNIDGTNRGIGFGSALQSRFASHGEILQHFTVSPLRKAKDCLVFIDEPEAALSLRNQYELVQSIHTALDNNCQLFVATHCLPVIQTFGKVYSVEHKQWMSSSDFILTQMNPRS